MAEGGGERPEFSGIRVLVSGGRLNCLKALWGHVR
jgi:hypothetical protein